MVQAAGPGCRKTAVVVIVGAVHLCLPVRKQLARNSAVSPSSQHEPQQQSSEQVRAHRPVPTEEGAHNSDSSASLESCQTASRPQQTLQAALANAEQPDQEEQPILYPKRLPTQAERLQQASEQHAQQLQSQQLRHLDAMKAALEQHAQQLQVQELRHSEVLKAASEKHAEQLSSQELRHSESLRAASDKHAQQLSSQELRYSESLSTASQQHAQQLQSQELRHTQI